ncbi:MAG: hypothetical protein AAFR75_04400, partial [Pseudomonadota bacterium]
MFLMMKDSGRPQLPPEDEPTVEALPVEGARLIGRAGDQQPEAQTSSILRRIRQSISWFAIEVTLLVMVCLVLAALGLGSRHAYAAEGVLMQPGDAVVTGFSGIRSSDQPMPVGADPLDHFVIDPDGPSAQVVTLSGSVEGPNGQLIPMVPRRVVTAAEVGQVFAATLVDRDGVDAPDVLLGATSLYGLNIIGPDADGNGSPDRLKRGQAGASWMPGQFGPNGAPGTIWKVDGATGAVSVFASVDLNSGAGLGDVVFNAKHNQVLVADLERGLVYRFDVNGQIIDTYDHGRNGRALAGYQPVDDDGVVADITSEAFDTQDPETWGLTQIERRVWGMTVHNSRLYYAVEAGRQVWSVGLLPDGGFAADVRWELDAQALPGEGPITDILFDKAGRLYLAQRGTAQGTYSYAWFATPGRSTVVRYRRDVDKAQGEDGAWVSDAEDYAVGMTDTHHFTNGGIALGYAYDENGFIK